MSTVHARQKHDKIQDALDKASEEAARRGEDFDEWDAMKLVRKERKIARQQKAPHYVEIAKQEGLQLKSFSGNSHFLVNDRYDWWPSSGAWRDRSKGPRGKTQYGFWRLVTVAKKSNPPNPPNPTNSNTPKDPDT
jgi:hypothetical protein